MKGLKSSVIVIVVIALAAAACSAKGVTGDDTNVVDAAPAPDLSRKDAMPDPVGPAPHDAAVDAAEAPDTSTGPMDAGDAAKCNAVLFFGAIGLPACDQCLTNECCAVTQTCLQLPDCSKLSDCTFACDGADAGACIQSCAAAHPSSVGKLNAWVSCMTDHCKGYCG